MKKILFLAFFYSTTNLLVFGGFNTISAQTPKHNRKLDSLRLDTLLKLIPDSVKRDIARSFKKCMDDLQRYSSPAALKSKTEFENNMSKALNLKLVVRDTDFKFSRMQIFNDTLVGHYRQLIKNKYYSEYFIQSLKDTSHIVEFNNDDLNDYPSTFHFDDYRNGCIYFGYGGTMETLCSDGKIKEYFPQYKYKLQYGKAANYTYKVSLYKNQAILIRSKDISSFNLHNQNLIWKYQLPENSNVSSLLKGDTLFFSNSINKNTTLIAYNITKQYVIWKKVFNGDSRYNPFNRYYDDHLLLYDNNNLILPTSSTCYTLDMNTGNVNGKIAWQTFFGDQGQHPAYKIEGNCLFIDDFEKEQETMKCIDFTTNKIDWELKDAYLLGTYGEYAIAYSPERLQYYFIIDKSTGSIKYKIPAPISDRHEFDFIGKYIFINEDAIYK